MKQEWEIKSLEKLEEEAVISLGRGIVISKKDLASSVGDYPVYSSAQLNDGVFGKYGKYMFDEELITWSVDGGGALFYRPKHKFSITNVGGYCRILKTNIISYQYLFFILTYLHSTIKFDWVKKAHPSVLRKEYKTIPIPPLKEQQRIASLLDKMFTDIEKAKNIAEQNLKNSRELFESYLQNIFENKGGDWEKVKLSEVAKVIGGYSFKSGDFVKQGKYQVLRIGNVRNGVIRTKENPVFIEKLDDSISKKALLLVGDVIITQTGTKNKRDYGFTVIVDKENYLLNQRVASIRFNQNYLSEFFLYYSWTNLFKDQYFANETGTVGQGNVGITAITDAIIPLTSPAEQEVVIKKINLLSSEIKKLEVIYEQKLRDLEELKKSILQKAFNGEL